MGEMNLAGWLAEHGSGLAWASRKGQSPSGGGTGRDLESSGVLKPLSKARACRVGLEKEAMSTVVEPL